MLKCTNPFYDWTKFPESGSDDAIKSRLRKNARRIEILRLELYDVASESKRLREQLSPVVYVPTVVKSNVRSTERIACYLCQKLTTNKVNGKFECREHSVVSRMSELERRVLNDFMAGMQ